MSRAAVDARLPLSALLSQAFVAFTIECDNEFEHQMPHRTTRFGSTPGATRAPWLISMAMWEHCLRHVPPDGISALDLARRARLTRPGAEMMLKRMSRWWGYLEIVRGEAGAARSASMVRLTPTGRRAQQIWDPLTDVISERWRARFGASAVETLRSGLVSLVEALDVVPAFMPITELGRGSRERLASARGASAGEASLPALLSGPLLAFAADVERRSGTSPVIGENILRVLGDEGVPVRRLSAVTGIADMAVENSLSVLVRRGHVAVRPDPRGGRARMATLTPEGVRARVDYRRGASEIEREWGRRCDGVLRAVREPLEILAGGGASPDSPLLAGLTPYPDGWRAQVPAPQTLPHFPFVSHRGGFPDGS